MKFATLAVALVLGLAVASNSDSVSKKFVNARYGYSFVVPTRWQVDEDPVPYISNFPSGDAEPQGEIPEYGAAIRIIPAEMFVGHYVKNVEEWIVWNTRLGQHDVERQDSLCKSPDEQRACVSSKVRSVFQLTPEDPEMINVSYYFLIGTKYFRAFLEYHSDDRNGLAYESDLKSITDSIMVARADSRKPIPKSPKER